MGKLADKYKPIKVIVVTSTDAETALMDEAARRGMSKSALLREKTEQAIIKEITDNT